MRDLEGISGERLKKRQDEKYKNKGFQSNRKQT